MPSRLQFLLALSFSITMVVIMVLGIRHQGEADRAKAWSEECAHSTYHLWESMLAWASAQHGVAQAEGHAILTNLTPAWSDLRPYYSAGPWPSNAPVPHCPGGGTWTLAPVSEWPICSIPSHAVAFRRLMEEMKAMARGVTNHCTRRRDDDAVPYPASETRRE